MVSLHGPAAGSQHTLQTRAIIYHAVKFYVSKYLVSSDERELIYLQFSHIGAGIYQ